MKLLPDNGILYQRFRLVLSLLAGVLFVQPLFPAGGLPAIQEVSSPDDTIQLSVILGDETRYTVKVDGRTLFPPSPISMTMGDGTILGHLPLIKDLSEESIDRIIQPAVKEKFARVRDHYNQLTISFKGGYSLVLRAYNNGVAYRFVTEFEEDQTIVAEEATFRFADTDHLYFPVEEEFFSHNERQYQYAEIAAFEEGTMASLPVLVESGKVKLLIAESALREYPGMWIKREATRSLKGTFPHYPLKSALEEGSDRNMPVTEYAEYLAKTKGDRTFPWRILAIAREDGDLLTNQLVYLLGEPQVIEDTSWIRPGKVAWDWWNALNLYGVDFRAGVNTATYKYFIEFASHFGIEYIILDEGWYKLGDVLDIAPEVNVEDIIQYGKDRNVRVILWVVWKSLDDKLEEALDEFAEWGVAGIKVDFMQRDDQEMVQFYWKTAEAAARRHLLVDFHGSYKPAGLRRTYPNVITREGVQGLENNKWSARITPEHDLTLPFVRMVPGPMDYTPGAMINAQERDFRHIFNRPMSMGTRAHQVAMYVVYESPLQMLADSPSNYLREPACTAFIARMPTTWDDTRVLEAKVGDYVVMARRHGMVWHVGAMTDGTAREFTISLDFLDPGRYKLEYIEDGPNADRNGIDHTLSDRIVESGSSLEIKLAPGGGWAGILTRMEE